MRSLLKMKELAEIASDIYNVLKMIEEKKLFKKYGYKTFKSFCTSHGFNMPKGLKWEDQPVRISGKN